MSNKDIGGVTGRDGGGGGGGAVRAFVSTKFKACGHIAPTIVHSYGSGMAVPLLDTAHTN